jgi:hypothetical protein
MQRNLWPVILAGVLGTGACGDSPSAPGAPTAVVEAGWSFGFCIGACRGELRLSGSTLQYTVTSRGSEETFADNRGSLTALGQRRLEGIATQLPAALQDRYGCPDCADGGAAFVTLLGQEARRIEYEFRRPPAELAALDGFLSTLMDALGSCSATPDVTPAADCTPAAEPTPDSDPLPE